MSFYCLLLWLRPASQPSGAANAEWVSLLSSAIVSVKSCLQTFMKHCFTRIYKSNLPSWVICFTITDSWINIPSTHHLLMEGWCRMREEFRHLGGAAEASELEAQTLASSVTDKRTENKMCPVQVWWHWPFPWPSPELKPEFQMSSYIFSRVSSSPSWCPGDRRLIRQLPSSAPHQHQTDHWNNKTESPIPAGGLYRLHCYWDCSTNVLDGPNSI